MKTFVGSYRFSGKQWGFDLCAEGEDDAEARLAALKAWGRIDGELVMRVPARMGWFVRLLVPLRNLLAR